MSIIAFQKLTANDIKENVFVIYSKILAAGYQGQNRAMMRSYFFFFFIDDMKKRSKC